MPEAHRTGGCSVQRRHGLQRAHVEQPARHEVAGACTAVEIAGRYHYVSGTVELVDASSARCTVTGNRTTLSRAGKGWKVQAFDAQGSRYAVRHYSNVNSALRGTHERAVIRSSTPHHTTQDDTMTTPTMTADKIRAYDATERAERAARGCVRCLAPWAAAAATRWTTPPWPCCWRATAACATATCTALASCWASSSPSALVRCWPTRAA